MAVIVVICLVAGLVVWRAMSTSTGGSASPSGPDAGAGGHTIGLVIDEDPICGDWSKASEKMAGAEKAWTEVDDTIPASQWTPDQRRIFEDVASAMTAGANTFEQLLPRAQDPIIQELVAQTITYLRLYVDKIPSYEYKDGYLAGVANNFGSAVTSICTSAPNLASKSVQADTTQLSTTNPSALAPFMSTPDAVCNELRAIFHHQQSLLSSWRKTDSSIPASDWSQKDRDLNKLAQEVLQLDADRTSTLIQSATGPMVKDLLFTYAQYLKAYAQIIPNYTPADQYIWSVAAYIAGGLEAACQVN
jgi:hypothetical protein